MKTTQTVKTIKKTSMSGSGYGATSGLGTGGRIITTKTSKVISGAGSGEAPPLLRRSSRGSRVWKKTILGDKFEYSEKLKEKKNYILYVSGMGHERKQIEEIEEMPKPEPPKEKIIEVRQIIDNYGYHETKSVKKSDPKRVSITHHERLSTPFERTTLKKFSSHTASPKPRGYISTTVQNANYDTGSKIKTTTINQYSSFTAKPVKTKTVIPPRLYETYKPVKTEYTKTTKTITTGSKVPNVTLTQPRNKTITQTQITKTKTEIKKYGDRRVDQNLPKYQPKLDNKYKRPVPADIGANQTKTETTRDGEYVVKVTTTRTQIGKYGKPEDRRGGSAPRSDIRMGGPRPDFEPPKHHYGFGGPHGPHGPYGSHWPHGPMGPHGFGGPHGPIPRMPGFERKRFEERIEREERIDVEEDERPRSVEKPPYRFMGPHGPYGPHGFMTPHGPMPHGPFGPHFGPHGYMGPHGPMPHGPFGPHGYMGPHGPMPHGPRSEPHGFMPPHGFMGPHGPMPHGPFGPHFEPHGFIHPHGFMGPHGPVPHGPFKSYTEPHGFMPPHIFIPPHGPMPPHGFMGPRPMPLGPHGFMTPHGPMPHGPFGHPHGYYLKKDQEKKVETEEGRRSTSVPKGKSTYESRTYQIKTEAKMTDKKPKPEHMTLPARSYDRPHGPMPHGPFGPHGYIPHGFIPPHGFMGPHGPMPHGPFGPHGFMGPHGPMPHGPFGPHGFMGPHGPHSYLKPREDTYPQRESSYLKEKMLTEGDIKKDRKDLNITGMSQYRFQQTTTKSDNGDNYEYFESKHVVKTGRRNQPITIHHRRGEKGGHDTYPVKKETRSSSYSNKTYNKTITTTKTQTQTQTRNEKAGVGSGAGAYTKIQTKTQTQTRNERAGAGKGAGAYTKVQTKTQTQVQTRNERVGAGAGLTGTKYTQKTTTYQNIKTDGGRKGYSNVNENKKYEPKVSTGARASSSSRVGMSQKTTETRQYQTIKTEQQKSGYNTLNEYKKYSQKEATGAGATTTTKIGMNKTMIESKRQEGYGQKSEGIYNKTYDESEIEVIFCPVHGKQLVRRKKGKKFN